MTKVADGTIAKMDRLDAHLSRQCDPRAARQALKIARKTKRRMGAMDRDLRILAGRYAIYKGLFERAMDIIKHQAEMIRDYDKRDVTGKGRSS